MSPARGHALRVRVSFSQTRAPFTREAPDVRRTALIEAAARVLAARAWPGPRCGRSAPRRGSAPGLLRHYFEGVDALVAAAYEATGARIDAALEAAVAAAGATPRLRLSAYLTASFAPPVLDPDLLATWLAFWSLVKVDPGHRRHPPAHLCRLPRTAGGAAYGLRPEGRRPAGGDRPDGRRGRVCGWSCAWTPPVFTPAEAGAIAERLAAGVFGPTCPLRVASRPSSPIGGRA